MKCPDIPDLAALTNCLQSAVEDGGKFLIFGSDLFTAAGQMAGYVAPSANPSFRIDQMPGQDIVQPGTTNVRVVGTASLFNNIVYNVEITGTVPAPNDVRLAMTLTPSDTSTWTFGANFTNLPDYTGYDYDAETSQIARLKSFFYDTVLNPKNAGDPLFYAWNYKIGDDEPGLYFEGTLDATKGTIGKQVGPYLPVADRPALPTEGPITVRESTFPLIKLTSKIPDLVIANLANAILLLGTNDDPGQDPPGSSTADMAGQTTISGFPTVTVSGPVLTGDFAWILTVTVDDPEDYSLANGMSALTQWVGGTTLTLPAGLDFFASFYISEIKIGLDPAPDKPVVDMLGISIVSSKDWAIPMTGLTLTKVGTIWRVVDPFGDASLIGNVFGTILVTLGGDKETAPRLQVNVDLSGLTQQFAPNVVVEATLDKDYPLNLGDLFEYFTGFRFGNPVDGLSVAALDLRGETGPRTFFFAAEIINAWQPLKPLFTFDTLVFELNVAANDWSGKMTATMHLSTLPFQIGANYRGEDKGWRFDGALLPVPDPTQLTLGAFLLNLNSNWKVPDYIGNIALLGLSVYFDTLTSEFGFDTTVGWSYTIDGISIQPEAQFKLDRVLNEQKQLVYTGFVRGTLKINAFEITVIYDFAVNDNNTLTFKIRYQNVILTCIYTKNKKNQSIIRANLGGVNFGEIVEYLVNLVDPDLGFKLTSPWDVLYQIKFDDLWLEVNLTTKTVGVKYDIKLNLAFVKIDSISLTYVNNAGETTVMIAIQGEFLGTKYGEDDPLEWDLLNDPPPSPPGEGEQLLDLRYLGFGQNVAFRETKSFNNVMAVITALEAEFNEVDETVNPLVQLPALKFSGDGNWLIGADFTVMSAVSLAGVFADPQLYGVRIGLAGPKVKTFDGLEFEILYKKITDTLGLYHIELKLPDAMRQLNFGAFAVTVPIVDVDIYTNGNFYIDMGFPVNMDFSKSFCVQGGPFIGYGGFYFGVLDGQTSSVVPRITNGSFSPVIEAGFALSVGLGRTIDKGVISGGLTLTLQGVVQGALGWFNPNDSSSSSAVYYRIVGTASLVGKIYGAIDFVIIKASFTATAYASITLVFEAYQPILIGIEVGVSVSVSVKIIFFTVTLSLDVKLKFSFTIGSGSTPPWTIAPSDNSKTPLRLRGQRTTHRLPPIHAVELFRMLRDLADEQPVFDWSPRAVFDAGVQPLDISLTPSLTPASDALKMVMALFIPTSLMPGALHPDEVRALVAENAGETPFNVMTAGVFRWTVGALQSNGVFRSDDNEVTIGQLDAIACFLADRKNRDATFTYDRVTGMIEQNFLLQLYNPIGPAGGYFEANSDVPRATDAASPQMAIFPMIPEIAMTPEGLPAIKFWEYACVDQAYRDALETYYDQLAIDPLANVPKDPLEENPCPSGPVSLAANGPLRSTPLPPGCAANTLPLSSIVFSDYFAMVSQQSVDAAVDLLNAYPYEATASETLDQIVSQFGGLTLLYRTRTGDSVATIAGAFRMHPSEVRRANAWMVGVDHDEPLPAGSSVQLTLGPNVAGVANANVDYPLNPGATMTVSGVLYQVLSGNTLGSVAAGFRIDSLGALINAEAIDSTGAVTRPNTDNVELLRAGGAFNIPQVSYTVTTADMIVPASDAFLRIAALFYTRSTLRVLGTNEATYIDWYQQTIASINAVIAPGVTLDIPIATLDAQGQIVNGNTTTKYVMKESDTIPWMASMFELLQLAPNDPGFVAFTNQITITPPPPIVAGTSLGLPPFAYTLSAGDTFVSIAETFYVPIDGAGMPAATAALANANPDTDILVPRAVLLLPELAYVIGNDETLGTVAQHFNLTVDELAYSAREDAGIFAPYATTHERMTVPDVASRDLDLLIADLIRFGSFNSIATGVSRFLLNGMRAPKPGAPSEELWGLYDVIGQQFAAPPGTTGYTIDFVKGSTAPWFCFDQAPGGSGCTGSLLMKLPVSFFEENEPAAVLDPQILSGPTGMRLYDDLPPQYTLQQNLQWQSATVIPLPGPTGGSGMVSAGEPVLWMFPQTLQQAVDQEAPGMTAPTAPYQLAALQELTTGGTTEKPLERYSWATAIPLTVTRAQADAGGFVPRAYQIVGADQAGRDLLLDAWSYLESSPNPNDTLYLLYAPSAQSQNSSGLASDALADAKTYLLKTNLSTETHSNTAMLSALAFTAGEYYSGIDTPGQFLKYIWEASITGTGGFFLNYTTTSGNGLPDGLFAADGSATIWAVLILARQSAASNPDRRLYPFNNCAVLAENLDASAIRIFAQLQDPAPDQLHHVASVPPGTIGFSMARVNASDAIGPTGITQRLYNLTGYQVLGNDDFNESHEGLPVTPQDTPPSGMSGPTAGVWYYQEVIPISRFGVVNDCPQSLALPLADDNPYRGITGPAGNLSAAKLSLAFHDTWGNETVSTEPMKPFDVPVGYIDEIIGVSSWPGTGFDYLFSPGIQLDTTLSLQIERYLPTADNAYDAAITTANSDAERYKQIFYQVQQHDLKFAMSSNIGTPQIANDDLKADVTAFVEKARVFSDAARQVLQVKETTQSESLEGFATRTAVTTQALAVVNKDVDASKLFAGLYVKPVVLAAPSMNTLQALADKAVGREGSAPSCNAVSTPDPGCSPASGLSLVMKSEAPRSFRAAAEAATGSDPETVAKDNATQPLTPGITLRTATRTVPLAPIFANKVANTLAAVAAAIPCNVYAEVVDPDVPKGPKLPTGLVWQNWSSPQLLRSGTPLTISGLTITTKDDSTFENLYAAFSAQIDSLTRGDFAAGIANSSPIFRTDKSVAVADTIIPQPAPSTQPGPALPTFSLADLAKQIDITNVPTLNRAVANFFNAGAPIFLGYYCCQAQKGDTIERLAIAASVTVEQFATFNSVTMLAPGVPLLVPNLTVIPDQKTCWSPYSASASSMLDSIAKAFGSDALTLANLNRYLPGIFKTGASITIGGKQVDATALDSLQSVYVQFPSLAWDAFVDAIAPMPSLYRENGVIVAPLAKVPAGASFNALASSLNVATSLLLQGNRALQKFLRDGAPLNAPGATAPITAGAFDTVDTIIRRFKEEQNVTVTIEGLVEANGDTANLMTQDAAVLLAPKPAEISCGFTPQVPPAGAVGEDAVIFPIFVSVEMQRSADLVAPDFRDNEAVRRNSSQLAPHVVASGTDQLTLADFADLFERSFAAYLLKCAVTSGAEGGSLIGKIFAVNFGSTGISRFDVVASLPKFYALAPLATETFTGPLTFPRYVSGEGLCGYVTKSFEGVDIDAWFLQFLQTIDLFLTPPYSIPAFQLGGETASFAPPQFNFDGPVGLSQMAHFFTPLAAGASGCTGMTGPHGPSDFDTIVGAKQTIATALRDNVWPIVDAPGASGSYEWDAARETLYQQMLVRLSDGYTTNAVVQFPVDVVSPFVTTDDDPPPRASGKVFPVMYALTGQPGSDTIAAVAAHYTVSPAFFAQVIGAAQGLLRKDATVLGYTIGPYDTVNSVAQHFGIPIDPADPSYTWAKWSAFIDSIAGASIFVIAASFPLSALKRQVYGGEAFGDIAEFFARDILSLAHSNQSLPGVLRSGAFYYQDYPNAYNVQPSDTLLAVAAGVSAANPTLPAVTIDDLAVEIRAKDDALQSGVTLFMVENIPDMSLSTSKVSMGRIDSPTGPLPALSFLLTVKNEAQRNKVLLNLDYSINEIEYAIRNVLGAGKYQASSWLTLILPIGSGLGVDVGVNTDVQQVQIPIPLRAYPPPSILRAHSGTTSYPNAVEMAKARLWDYRFDVQTRKAAQDTDHIEVKFGEQIVPNTLATAAGPSLITWLAAFIDAYPSLSQDLALLTTNTLNDTSGYAVASLAIFAAQIAAALSPAADAEFAGVPPVDIYQYRMTTETDGVFLRTLTLDVELGPSGASAVWPDLFIKSITGMTGTGPDAGFLPMEGAAGFYLYPENADYPADADLTYRFLFHYRDVIRNQTGRGGIAISRNDNLIAQGPLGPTGAPDAVPTSEEFIYRTPLVEFANPLIPLIDNDGVIDISQPSPQPLNKYLLALLQSAIDVFPGGFTPSQYIDMLCLYGFNLGDAGLLATTPIRLVPSRLVGGDSVASFASSLAASLSVWQSGSGVAPDRGVLVFQLSVFTESQSTNDAAPSTVDGMPLDAGLFLAAGPSATPLKPIFRLHNIQLRMNSIDWAASGPTGDF